MPVAKTHRVVHFRCHNTRRNLPPASALKRGESNFLARFERIYLESELRAARRKHRFAAGREFALDGFGRADILFMAWTHERPTEDFTAMALKSWLKLTAIEAKMKDWRKGLMQAARYRFFANRSLLVLPPASARVAAGYITTFRDLNVGLWEFDPSTDRIRKHFTPRSRRPLNLKAREKAVHAIKRGLKLS